LKDGPLRMDGLRFYLDEMKGNTETTTWDDIGRIIKDSSNEGDLVEDFFCMRKGTRILAPYPLSKSGEGEDGSPSPGLGMGS
jgi:hypothetical protein